MLVIAAARKILKNRQGKTSKTNPMKRLTQAQKDKLKANLKKVGTAVIKSQTSGQKAPAQKPVPKPAQKKETNVGWNAPLDLGFVKTTRKNAAIGAALTLVVGGIVVKTVRRKRN